MLATGTIHIFLICIRVALVYTADFDNEGRTTIPWNLIPPTETTLTVQDNDIATVDWAPSGMALEEIRLQDNRLTEFPNFVNLSSTLQLIYLGDNSIAKITPVALLSSLVELRELSMRDNPLIALPDVAYFPPKLDYLSIHHSNLKTLPNMCFLETSNRPLQRLHVKHEANQYTCDIHMFWIKIAYNSGILSVDYDGRTLPSPECDTPGSLAGIAWNNITEEQLIAKDADIVSGLRQYNFQRIDSTKMFCYPRLVSVTHGISRRACGTWCIKTPNCVLFATDDGQCVITEFKDGVLGTREQFLLYSNWYMLN